jgi:hypothetical protein
MTQQMTDDDVKRTFYWFFEASFGREMDLPQRQALGAELLNGLVAGDASVRELVVFVLQTAQKVLGEPQRQWPHLLAQSRAIWEAEFRKQENNGRGRVKALLAEIFSPGLMPPLVNTAVQTLAHPQWNGNLGGQVPQTIPTGATGSMGYRQAGPVPMYPQQVLPDMGMYNTMDAIQRATRDQLHAELTHKLKMMDLEGGLKALNR